MSRTVLITGAGGFVGSHLAAGFASMGDAVTALDRWFDERTVARLGGVTLREAELNGDALADLGRFDLVIHGAALTTTAQELGISETAHIKANLDSLLDCLDFARRSGTSQFVFISSSGVFDDADSADVLLESVIPTSLAPYAVAKRCGEIIVEAAKDAQFAAFSIRLGPVYGPFEASRGSRKRVSMVRRWLDTALAGEPIIVAEPVSRREWTFAPDLAPALDVVLRGQRVEDSVIHFCAPDITSEPDLAMAIAGVVPGTRIETRSSGGVRRLPMGSDRIDLAALYPWTPLADGLAQIIAAEGRA